MGLDKNTITGFLLMMLMLIGYNYFVPTPQPEKTPIKTEITHKVSTSQTTLALPKPVINAATGVLPVLENKQIILENNDIKVVFGTQGGKIKEVILKNYKTYNQQSLVLFDDKNDAYQWQFETTKGKLDIGQVSFATTATNKIVSSPQGEKIVFTAKIGNGSLTQTYTLPVSGYEIGYNLHGSGIDSMIVGKNISLDWTNNVQQTEFDTNENRTKSTVNYHLTDDTFDWLPEKPTGIETKTLEKPVKWISFKQKYFVTGIIPAQGVELSNVSIKSTANENDSLNIKTLQASMAFSVADFKAGKITMKLFFGPNKYKIVNAVAEGFWQNVYLGYAFVRPINRYIFVPLFDFLQKFFSNYGVLIFVLVVLLKLVLMPLVYKSYISMAKMRVLQPEINAIKEKIGDDAAKVQQETMKLYQQVGVSPLSGCVPVVLQMPILMSVFFLFPNLIELRQQSFLWAPDLSTYDNILNFGFHLPVLGDHLSIFTLLMTISSVAYAYYNNQITPAQPGPIDMKMMGYITPIIFMFVLNSFPAGLCWYYFVSNVVTITQQLGIRRFVDEDKIRTVLDENRKKFFTSPPKKQSRFQQLMEKSLQAADEARKQQEDTKKQDNKKRK